MDLGHQRNGIIRDYEKLSFEYVPDVLIHREFQMQRLQTIFRPILHGIRRTAVLVGNVGTGKTATAKRFCQTMERYGRLSDCNIAHVVINCRQKRSEYTILHAILSYFDPNYPRRGIAQEEYVRSIQKHLSTRKMNMIVVLDEADIILKKGANDLIYTLTRLNEDYTENYSLSLIMISQRHLVGNLDQAALSTFCKSNVVTFERYNALELRDIIKSRVDLAFYPGTVSEECIDMIAEASAELGDARFAIELLESAGLITEEMGLTEMLPECIREAKNMTYSRGSNELRLSNLDLNRKLVLLAICRSMGENSYATSQDAETAYRIASEECNIKPKGSTSFWKYLKDLSAEGWIDQKSLVDPAGAGGRTTCIYVNDFPVKDLKLMIEKELNLIL